MRIVIMSDTHSKNYGDMPKVLKSEIANADAVLHAGDIGNIKFYSDLKAESKVLYSVLGNNDSLELPREIEIELDGVKIALIHGDQAPFSDRESWLLYRFAEAELIIFGHTHVPFMLETGTQTLLNPGSVKHNRTVPYNSFAILKIKNGTFTIEFIKV